MSAKGSSIVSSFTSSIEKSKSFRESSVLSESPGLSKSGSSASRENDSSVISASAFMSFGGFFTQTP